MKLSDNYICNTCGNTFEYAKEYGDDYPEAPECTRCNSVDTRRDWAARKVHVPMHMRSGM